MFTKTTSFTSTEAARQERKWYIVDLDGETLGRAASRIAHILRGKHKPTFTPHTDDGDYVVVINAANVRLTGNKLSDKMYYRHTGYIGGVKETNAEKLLERNPTALIENAVKGMLPRGPLGRAQFKKLKVFAGNTHSHASQNPEVLSLDSVIIRSQEGIS